MGQKFDPYLNNVFLSNCIKIDKDSDILIKSPADRRKELFRHKSNNNFPFSIFKYLKQERAKDYLKNNNLCFVSPSLWEDPYEYTFYDENMLNGKKIFCFCSSYSRSINEEAFWKRYNPDFSGEYVMWSLNFFALLTELSKIGKRDNIDFYVSLINYSLTQKNISKKKKTINNKKTVNLKDQLLSLSLKRKAYAHECELRIFAVVDANTIKDNIIEIPITLIGNDWRNRVLTKVVLPPYKPGKKGQFSEKEYAIFQYIMNRDKRDFYSNYGYKGSHEVEQCHLFEVNYPYNSEIKKIINQINK